ncbi:MAG: hypothetical protein IIZ39_13120 [Blautia sp.]|nr:hypothetical protein [Blautia sp.]
MQTISQSISSWSLYWGEGKILFLAGAALLYLFLRKRKERKALYFLLNIAILLFFFFFPPTAMIVCKAIDGFVYWRYLWTLPLIPLVALFGTYLVKECRGVALKIIVCLLMVLAIAFTGTGFWTTYERQHNNQQVPDVVAGALEIVNADRQGKEVRVAANDAMAAYVRVYDASLLMPYGRAGRGAVSKKAVQLYRLMNQTPKTDYQTLAKRAKKLKVDYLLVEHLTKKGKKILKKAGYKKIGKVNAVVVMKRKKK